MPGLPGWGRKSAATVLAAYRHIESIPDDPARWTVTVRGRDRLAATLSTRRPDALLYRQLATLRTDVPLAERLDDLRWLASPARVRDLLRPPRGRPAGRRQRALD
ncbi:MAG: 5'-3' exonuclease H3TH domain-containing protein [Candidatus Binatia bacterium]